MQKDNTVSRAKGCFLWLLGGLTLNLAAALIFESSAVAGLRANNPISKLAVWLGTKGEVSHVVLLSLVGWSLAAFIYFFLKLSSVTIFRAVYFTPQNSKDVTERVRKAVEEEGVRSIPVTNEFLLGSDKDIEYLTPKKLTVEYAKLGCRRQKTADEFERLEL